MSSIVESKAEKEIRAIFDVSVILKGLDGLAEIILGVLLFFNKAVINLANLLIHKELVEDPTDFVATHIRNFLPYLSSHAELFAAFYLLAHGVIKIFLVWGLLKRKLWAYPSSMIFLMLFIMYQVIRYFYTHSVFLIFLSVFDAIIFGLVWHEYDYMKMEISEEKNSEKKS